MIELTSEKFIADSEFSNYLGKGKHYVVYKRKQTIWLRQIDILSFPRIVLNLLRSSAFCIARKNENRFTKVMGKSVSDLVGKYRIVNYEAKYFLFKSVDQKASSDRQHFWGSIKKYNEHKSVDNQINSITKRTEWLAQTINNYNPKSVLELGCGAARNLIFLARINAECKLNGVEINEQAISVGKKQLGDRLDILSNSVYELSHIESNSVDVVFTSGLLMHIPHDEVEKICKECTRIAKKSVLHYELHGPEHDFDFHRYPRDYQKLYSQYENISYEVYDRNEFKGKGTDSFNHCLLVYNINE